MYLFVLIVLVSSNTNRYIPNLVVSNRSHLDLIVWDPSNIEIQPTNPRLQAHPDVHNFDHDFGTVHVKSCTFWCAQEADLHYFDCYHRRFESKYGKSAGSLPTSDQTASLAIQPETADQIHQPGITRNPPLTYDPFLPPRVQTNAPGAAGPGSSHQDSNTAAPPRYATFQMFPLGEQLKCRTSG